MSRHRRQRNRRRRLGGRVRRSVWERIRHGVTTALRSYVGQDDQEWIPVAIPGCSSARVNRYTGLLQIKPFKPIKRIFLTFTVGEQDIV